MSKLAFAAFAAAMAFAAPSFAQDARIRIDERGVTVRSDDHRRDRGPRWREERRHDRFVERRRWRDRDVGATGSVGCRTVTVRSTRPDGTTVTRRSQRCS